MCPWIRFMLYYEFIHAYVCDSLPLLLSQQFIVLYIYFCFEFYCHIVSGNSSTHARTPLRENELFFYNIFCFFIAYMCVAAVAVGHMYAWMCVCVRVFIL